MWFHQIEAEFVFRRITTQLAKYYHVVSGIPFESTHSLDDLLDAFPAPNPYDELQSLILCMNDESENSCVRLLLNIEDLGDRRPTQLLFGYANFWQKDSSRLSLSFLGSSS